MRISFKSYWFMMALAFVSMALFTQCDNDDEAQPSVVFVVDGNGYSQFNHNALQNALDNLPHETLSVEEEAGLLFMREEEKLAHDVYVKMYEKWDIQAFDNISESEQTHTEAVFLLLDKYDLADPVGSNGIGIFSNSTLQGLYDDLVALGNQSAIEALKVGAAVEEIDILDLRDELTNVVDNQDIQMVYENLEKGSRNHLRAFVKNLANRGVTYVPQYLSQEDFDEIINGEMENGN